MVEATGSSFDHHKRAHNSVQQSPIRHHTVITPKNLCSASSTISTTAATTTTTTTMRSTLISPICTRSDGTHPQWDMINKPRYTDRQHQIVISNFLMVIESVALEAIWRHQS